MPVVRLEIIPGKTREYKQAVLDAVHSALVEAFQIPDWDRNQRLFEVNRQDIELPPGKTDQYVLIEITAFQGRSAEAKKALFAAVAGRLADSPGIRSEDITVVIHDVPPGNWGLRGRPASELQPGFKIDE